MLQSNSLSIISKIDFISFHVIDYLAFNLAAYRDAENQFADDCHLIMSSHHWYSYDFWWATGENTLKSWTTQWQFWCSPRSAGCTQRTEDVLLHCWVWFCSWRCIHNKITLNPSRTCIRYTEQPVLLPLDRDFTFTFRVFYFDWQ